MNQLGLAMELLQEMNDLLDRMLDINNDAVQALMKNPETRDIGELLGEKAHDVLQYGFQLEADERFQQFYEQETAE
jgi:hypothetical protein